MQPFDAPSIPVASSQSYTGWQCPVCKIALAPWVRDCHHPLMNQTTTSTTPTVWSWRPADNTLGGKPVTITWEYK